MRVCVCFQTPIRHPYTFHRLPHKSHSEQNLIRSCSLPYAACVPALMLFFFSRGSSLHTNISSSYLSYFFIRQTVLSVAANGLSSWLASTLSDLKRSSNSVDSGVCAHFVCYFYPVLSFPGLCVQVHLSSLRAELSLLAFHPRVINTCPMNPGHLGSCGFSVSRPPSRSVFINPCLSRSLFSSLACTLCSSLSSPLSIPVSFLLFCPRVLSSYFPLSSPPEKWLCPSGRSPARPLNY